MTGSINCYQLTAESALSDDNYVRLARLIYRTDDYIYPCIFENEANAVMVLANLLKQGNDAMFSKENCFVAMIGDNIAGVILWKRGALLWDSSFLVNQARKDGVSLSEHFDLVQQAYFSSYEKKPQDQISLINVCVDRDLQGCGVGSVMMEQYVREHQNEKMELYVLADNKAAINLYREHARFEIVDRIQGFSHDRRDLPCLVMQR